MISNVKYNNINYVVITYTRDKKYITIIANEDKHKFLCEYVFYNEFEGRLIHKNIIKNIGKYLEVIGNGK